jgi:magnesium-transporting ATPase (P-type)
MSEEEIMKILTQDPAMQQQMKQQQQQQHQQQESSPGAFIPLVFRFGWQLGFLALLGLVSFVSLFYVKYADRRVLLTFACYFVFIICVGGVIYNAIHQTELYHHNPYTGKMVFLYPEMRSQFALEGYFASMVMIVAGATFVGMTQLLPLVESSSNRRAIGWLLYSLFWMSVGTLFIIFSMKMPSYL